MIMFAMISFGSKHPTLFILYKLHTTKSYGILFIGAFYIEINYFYNCFKIYFGLNFDIAFEKHLLQISHVQALYVVDKDERVVC